MATTGDVATSRGRARVFGSPGERPRLNGLARAAWPVLAVAAAAGYLLRALVPRPALSVPHVGLLFLGLAAALAFALFRSRTRLAAFLKGARGEERVARELALLPAGYTVYHGLSGGRSGSELAAGSDWDHVVAGPTGVFVIETKNWTGQITVREGAVLYDGRQPQRPPLDQVKAAVAALRHGLQAACGRDVPVHPVVCFASDALDGGVAGACGVLLCNAGRLNEVLQAAPDERPDEAALAKVNAYLRQRVD